MPRKIEYVYILVRKDLPSKEDILVQAAHAALESGLYFGEKGADPYFFCVLEVENEDQLKEAMYEAEARDIRFRGFIEPDLYYRFTAMATEPIEKSDKVKRGVFARYKLLKFDYNDIRGKGAKIGQDTKVKRVRKGKS